jgi:hypothetical protein
MKIQVRVRVRGSNRIIVTLGIELEIGLGSYM